MSFNSRQGLYRPASAPRATKDRNGDIISAAEATRLRDCLKAKEREVETLSKQLTTLRIGASVKEKALQQLQDERDALKEKATQSAGDGASMSIELDMIKAVKKKLESQVADLMRQNEKLKGQIAALGCKSPGIAMEVSTLHSRIRSLKDEGARLEEHGKALENIIRNKDRELVRQQKKVEEADAVLKHNLELENQCKELAKMLEELRAENKTLQHVNRTREADIAKLQREQDATKASLTSTLETLSSTKTVLKASQNRTAELEQEVAVLRDELARTSAVASRVAVAEVKAGNKDEGTIPVMQHIEEVKYLHGDISRLKDKVASLEKQLQVADDLKDKFKAAAQANGGLSSRRVSVGSRRVSGNCIPAGRSTQSPRGHGAAPAGHCGAGGGHALDFINQAVMDKIASSSTYAYSRSDQDDHANGAGNVREAKDVEVKDVDL